MGKTYFASDFHLGVDAQLTSRERERKVVRWLHAAAADACAIYLVGDLFDFWYEYRSVVPKGHVRLLGTLATLQDSGIDVHVFTGNHDLWMRGYLSQEIGLSLHQEPIRTTIGDAHFLIGHGDGLGPGDRGYKRLKRIFTNPVLQWWFSRLHPNFAFRIAQYFSDQSRMKNSEEVFQGESNEWLLQYAEQSLEAGMNIDYFVFGHRHLTIDYLLSNGRSRYLNLGEWLHTYSYACFDGQQLQIGYFENDNLSPVANHDVELHRFE